MNKVAGRVLGIDPSTVSTGWAIVDMDSMQVVAHGTICPNKKLNEQQKIHIVYQGITDIIKEYGPTDAACEDQFGRQNLKTLMKLSRLVGSILLACEQNNLTVALFAPTHVKAMFTGRGTADKQDMIDYAKTKFNISEELKSDEADAIGVAVTYLEENNDGTETII